MCGGVEKEGYLLRGLPFYVASLACRLLPTTRDDNRRRKADRVGRLSLLSLLGEVMIKRGEWCEFKQEMLFMFAFKRHRLDQYFKVAGPQRAYTRPALPPSFAFF